MNIKGLHEFSHAGLYHLFPAIVGRSVQLNGVETIFKGVCMVHQSGNMDNAKHTQIENPAQLRVFLCPPFDQAHVFCETPIP
jgi:hypothetical protein